jgi:RNA polymerase sigma-70 factor (ECF subfamily)
MDDDAAIGRCLEGEGEAFAHLVRRYQARALGHARMLTGNAADAADAAQEAFLDAFRHLRRFERGREFYPWFYTLLRNRSLKSRARQVRRREDPATAAPDAPMPSGAPEDRVALAAALEALDADDRELIVLKHLDGWTYDELSARLGIPRGTVMSRLYHARLRLQGMLKGREQ